MKTVDIKHQAPETKRLNEKASILILAIGILSIMTLMAFAYLMQIRLESGTQKAWFVRERNVLVAKGSLEAELGHFYTAGINPQYYRCSWYQKTPGIFIHQNILLAGSGYLKDGYPKATSTIVDADGQPTFGYDPNALPAAHCRDPWQEIFPDGMIFSQWNADAFTLDTDPGKTYGFGSWSNGQWNPSPALKNVFALNSATGITMDSNDPNHLHQLVPSDELRPNLSSAEVQQTNSWYDGTQNQMASVDYLLYMNSNTVLAANPIPMPLFPESEYLKLVQPIPPPAPPVQPTKDQELYQLYKTYRPFTVRSIGENWFGSSYSEHNLVKSLASNWLGTGYWDTPAASRAMAYSYLPHQHFYVYDFYDVIAFGMWDQNFNNTFSRFANLRTKVGASHRVVPFMQRECIAMGINYPYNALGEADPDINATLSGKPGVTPKRDMTASLPYSPPRAGLNEPNLYWGNNPLSTAPAIKIYPNTWKITVNYYMKEPVVQTWLTSSVLEGWFGNIAKYSCRLGTCPYYHKISPPLTDANGDGVIDANDAGTEEPICTIDQYERQIFLPQNTE